MVKVIKKSQIDDYAKYLDELTLQCLSDNLMDTFETFGNCNLIKFRWYDIYSQCSRSYRIMIYVSKSNIFFICEDEAAFEKCNSLLEEESTIEKTLYQFFVKLLARDVAYLESLEQRITNVEDRALENPQQDYLKNIHDFHKELLKLKRYYEDISFIMDYLVANDNEIFSEEGVRYFTTIHNRASHFFSNVIVLRDYVSQMREACQSQIDIEQNKIMKVFTLISVIFLPPTLITGWYGMNFKLIPELNWSFGYFYVIVLSSSVVGLIMLWLKHKKML